MSEFNHPITEKIAGFLREIGLRVEAGSIEEATFLQGILIRDGVLVIDEAKLKFPGDLLHEAGHLAVVDSARRNDANHNVGKKAHEEIAAIAWSYAALIHLELDPTVVFHAEGYRGGSESIIENFSNRRYFGVPILQWLGMTVEKSSGDADAEIYPRMSKWLAD